MATLASKCHWLVVGSDSERCSNARAWGKTENSLLKGGYMNAEITRSVGECYRQVEEAKQQEKEAAQLFREAAQRVKEAEKALDRALSAEHGGSASL